MNFTNKNITIVGLGVSNLAVVKYLADRNIASLIITDLKKESELENRPHEVKGIYPKAKLTLGKHHEQDFSQADIIIRSPSIPPTAPLIARAIDQGKQVETDISLFFKLCLSSNIIGVTGTKGKTTTATFIAKMLIDQGFDTILGGNMGIPVMSKLGAVTSDSWVVLELSSFMIESLDRHHLSPRIAVYTSLFPDHLNLYRTFANYKNSKKGLFKYQNKNDLVFLCKDDEELRSYLPEIPSTVCYFDSKDVPKSTTLKVRGYHYRTNIGAGFAIAKQLKLDIKKVNKTAQGFEGVAHRMENLGVINDIEFINNSASTNPGSFLADLQTLLDTGKPIYLLGGGSDKNLDFTAMIEAINDANQVRKIALFAGAGTDKLKEKIQPEKITGIFDAMPQAFASITNIAGPGSVIALSPGCASFGVFKDEFDRGEQFKRQYEHYSKELPSKAA